MNDQATSSKGRRNIVVIAILLIVVAVFAVVGTLLVTLTKAAPANVVTTNGPSFGLYLNPQSATVSMGTELQVSAYANLSTNSVESITALVRYDPALLKLVAADQTGVQGFNIVTVCSPTDSCRPAGEVVLALAKTGGEVSNKQGILVGNLKFTALKTGPATISFDQNPALSGFTSKTTEKSVLDTRQISNSTLNLVKGKGKRIR